MIENNAITPSSFAMTTLALVTLATAVDISAGMTLPTGGFIFFIARRTLVAGATDDVPMLATQRKFGRFIVIKLFLGPALRRMAALALFAITALMFIIGTMTAVTIGCQFGFEIGVVATLTRRRCMPPQQLVVRVAIMIKGGALPALRRVATLAVITITILVHVVDAVAGDALLRYILVLLAGVTQRAIHLAVFASERIVCLAVIKAGITPLILGVAFIALRA